jgi:hypothetical protein
MQRVLTSWRERDAGDGGAAAERAEPVASAARAAAPERQATAAPERQATVVSERHDWLSRAAMRSPLLPPQALVATGDAREPRHPVPAQAQAQATARGRLAPGAIDGLTADVVRLLAEAGVHDLEALGRADVLALARSTGLGFTALQRLGFLARRNPATGRTRPAHAAARARPSAPPAPAAAVEEERFSVGDGPPRPEHGTLLSERDYELRPRPPTARSPRNEQRGPEVPGGPFA